MEKAKPFVLGFVSGVIVAAVVGFGTGWVVTAGAKEQAIRAAKIHRLAAICAAQATDHWQAQGEDPAALRGWDNREQREKLAERFTAALRVEGPMRRDIIDECSRVLDA